MLDRHGDLLSSKGPLSAHRAERRWRRLDAGRWASTLSADRMRPLREGHPITLLSVIVAPAKPHRSNTHRSWTRNLDIFDFHRKPFTLFHFTDRSSRLTLALETQLCRVSGTIVGQFHHATCPCPLRQGLRSGAKTPGAEGHGGMG